MKKRAESHLRRKCDHREKNLKHKQLAKLIIFPSSALAVGFAHFHIEIDLYTKFEQRPPHSQQQKKRQRARKKNAIARERKEKIHTAKIVNALIKINLGKESFHYVGRQSAEACTMPTSDWLTDDLRTHKRLTTWQPGEMKREENFAFIYS